MNYRQHKRKWENCRECRLCETRKNVVLARGVIPCDVLFVGEGPAHSEDTIGKPFVGPAGLLLDEIIESAMHSAFPDEEPPDVAFTNLVCCIPKDSTGTKVHDPPAESIKACAPRLREFVEMASPKLLVAVGAIPARWIPKLLKLDPETITKLTHPAALLRMDVTQQGLQIQKTVVVLADALEEMEP